MAGRPIDIKSVMLVKKLRKKKPPMSFRKIVEHFKTKGKVADLKTIHRWSKYPVGKIVDNVLDSVGKID